MSNITYEEMLRECMVDLREQLELDQSNLGHKVTNDRKAEYQYFLHNCSSLYIRYLQIFRKLEMCHDQVLHPQKRADVRILLDSCMGRMLELKDKITRYCGQFVNFDDVLVDLKLTPEALEIPIPKYFLEERAPELKARKTVLEALVQQYDVDKDNDGGADGALGGGKDKEGGGGHGPGEEMSLEKALLVLQCNERGRQGRQRAKFMKEIREQEERERKILEAGTTIDQDPQKAAVLIQKIFKGFAARKKAKAMMMEELEFLGMEMSAAVKSNVQKEAFRTVMKEHKTTQKRNQTELGEEFKTMRNRIKETEGGQIMEAMHDDILERLLKQRSLGDDNVVPVFPTEEEGGSLTLIRRAEGGDEEEERLRQQQEEEAAKKGGDKKGGKDSKKGGGKKDGKKGKDGKGKGGEEEEPVEVLQPSVFWTKFQEGTQKYVEVWQDRFNPQDFQQKLDKEILHFEIMDGPGGLRQELRGYVDALVRVELSNLKAALERDKKQRNPPQPKPEKPKDPPPIKKLDVEMNKLVLLGALQICPEVHITDYIGAPNLMGAVLEEHEKVFMEQLEEIKSKWQQLLEAWDDTVEKSLHMTKDQFVLLFEKWLDTQKNSGTMFLEPSMAQVRQTVTEYGIIPLGSQVVHDLVPPRPLIPDAKPLHDHRTLLLYGPSKSGKTMLAHAIATETGSNLFVLSNKVLNNDKLNPTAIPEMIKSVFRVARAQAPSVIYIDDVEKVFVPKRRPKGAPDPGKLPKIKKDLLQQMKEMECTDRVLVVGSSSAPWNADFKEFCAFFGCMVQTISPDYASRLLLFQTKIGAKGAALPKDYDYEILAYMTNKYSSGTIVKVIEDTLTDRRVKRLGQRPLKSDEFLFALARAQPVFRETFEQFREFTLKLPMHMRMANTQDFKVDEEDLDPKGKGKGGKGKGGKGKGGKG
eukprot:PhF_6_TR11693/c1_g1_i1/m.18980